MKTKPGKLPSAEIEKQVLTDYLDWFDKEFNNHRFVFTHGSGMINKSLIDKFVSGK